MTNEDRITVVRELKRAARGYLEIVDEGETAPSYECLSRAHKLICLAEEASRLLAGIKGGR